MPKPRFQPAGVSQRGMQMETTYKFAPVPSNSSVAGLVTLMVSAWFLVAAGAIFADPAFARGERSPAVQAQRTAATAVAAAPDAHFKITVEAQRLKS